jgi:hypothetical protein
MEAKLLKRNGLVDFVDSVGDGKWVVGNWKWVMGSGQLEVGSGDGEWVVGSGEEATGAVKADLQSKRDCVME